jgi:hypothetical protein
VSPSKNEREMNLTSFKPQNTSPPKTHEDTFEDIEQEMNSHQDKLSRETRFKNESLTLRSKMEGYLDGF